MLERSLQGTGRDCGGQAAPDPRKHPMRQTLALAGCSTMTPEFYACVKQLGLGAKLYGTRPVCLFKVPVERLDDLLTRAGARHDHVVLALGACCGDMSGLAARHGATLLEAQNCRHLYLGQAAYQWCGEHHILPLSCHCFRMTLRQARDPLRKLLGEIIEAQDVRSIAAIDDGLRHPEPACVEQIARMTGRDTFVMHTGLGHLREALRAAAREEGVEGDVKRTLIPPESLGPGDDLLLVGANGAPCLDTTLQLLANSLGRGMKAVWIVGQTTMNGLEGRLWAAVPDWKASREAGAIELVTSEALLAQVTVDDGPEGLVRFWKARALDALNHGYTGLAVIHGFGWSESAGLPIEFLLDYASRLSGACAQWPILSASECPLDHYSPAAFDEITHTHPVVWASEGVSTSETYEPMDEYLGAEGLLEALERERPAFACSEIAPLISALVDGELSGSPAAAVAEHVSQCPKCGELMLSSRDLKSALHALGEPAVAPPHDLWERLSEQIR